MLGDQIYEHKGKVTDQRVLDVTSSGEGSPKIETSFSASAKIKGRIDITDIGTYSSVARPRGRLYGEGQGVMMTKDDQEMTIWTAQRVGCFTGRGGGVSSRGSTSFVTQRQ
jgi:hypothetical protein